LKFFGFAAPDGAAEQVAGDARAADLEEVAPNAVAALALTHLIENVILIV
jgi:hypothetical protein